MGRLETETETNARRGVEQILRAAGRDIFDKPNEPTAVGSANVLLKHVLCRARTGVEAKRFGRDPCGATWRRRAFNRELVKGLEAHTHSQLAKEFRSVL